MIGHATLGTGKLPRGDDFGAGRHPDREGKGLNLVFVG